MEVASTSKGLRTQLLPECMDDRLSSVPDDLLYRIFFYLDNLDVVRTCTLGKRWRYIWATSPYLNFSADWFARDKENRHFEFVDTRYKFWDFVKWSLILRNDDAPIIRLCVSTDNTMTDQLNGLLLVAAKKQVQDICISDGDYAINPLDFPLCLCESLEKISLSFRDNIPIRAATAFCNLKSLRLIRVSILDAVVGKILSNDCTKLEDIYLEDCQVKDTAVINISARLLKNLTIVNASTYGEKFWVVGCFDSKIIISAPNLLSFCYVGPMLHGFVFVNTESLEMTTIRILLVPAGYQVAYKNHLFSPESIVGLNYAKALTLSSVAIKYFCPTYNKISWDAFLLDKLSRLEVEIRYNANHIEGLINLLKCTPSLEALFIRFKQSWQHRWLQNGKRKANKGGSSWKSRVENVACLSYNVKVIQISQLNSEEIALELLKFLLQNGRALEKMEILHMSVEMKMRNLARLESLAKAFSVVVISFPKLYPRAIPWFDKGDSDPE